MNDRLNSRNTGLEDTLKNGLQQQRDYNDPMIRINNHQKYIIPKIFLLYIV